VARPGGERFPHLYGPRHRPGGAAVGKSVTRHERPAPGLPSLAAIELLARHASALRLQVGRRPGVWGLAGPGLARWPGRGKRRSLLGELKAGPCAPLVASISTPPAGCAPTTGSSRVLIWAATFALGPEQTPCRRAAAAGDSDEQRQHQRPGGATSRRFGSCLAGRLAVGLSTWFCGCSGAGQRSADGRQIARKALRRCRAILTRSDQSSDLRLKRVLRFRPTFWGRGMGTRICGSRMHWALVFPDCRLASVNRLAVL